MESAALCSGLGRCGLCRVRFKDPRLAPEPVSDEYNVLGEPAVAQGWRLGCRHIAQPGMSIEVPVVGRARGIHAPRPLEHLSGALLAVDLGTTSLQWKAVSLQGDMLASGHCLNPQLGAGSDVMSRIAEALEPAGRSRLRGLLIQVLHSIVRETPAHVDALCVAGNTAMTAILLDKDLSGLAGAPYTVPDTGGRFVDLPGLPPTWVPFQPAPFIGGDIAAGVTALLHAGTPQPFLLADMGTNGEIALVLDSRTVFAGSVPLGPALEGIGLRNGVLAGPGAIVEFALSPQGLLPRLYEGEQPAADRITGITGTGYLSLIAQLRHCGALNTEGQPVRGACQPLAARILRTLRHLKRGGWQLELPFGLVLTADDVETLLKVRAAFSLAVRKVIESAGQLPATREGIAVWALAGALGEHVPRQALEELGFVPPGLGARLQCVGNTSLEGALQLLREPSLRAEQRNWHTVDVTTLSTFATEYIDAMRFESWHA